MSDLYSTSPWRELRAQVVARDGNCIFARLIGGCSGALHAHHLTPIAEGGDELPPMDELVTLCAAHHRVVHDMRAKATSTKAWRKCKHQHRTREGREACERRLNAT